MKAVEKIINDNWYLFIKDGNTILIKIAAPNEFNYHKWRISLKCGICYDYDNISDIIDCLNDMLKNLYNTDVSKIMDNNNYRCDLLLCFQDKILNI